MQFLEECRKVEDEDKVGQVKINPLKAKVAAATVPPTRDDELAKQLRYQQHQIDTLVGQVKALVSAVKATRPTSQRGYHRWSKNGSDFMERRFKGNPLRTTPQPRTRDPRYLKGLVKIIDVGSVENWGI